jgi:RNA polymerase sigma factor (sigma-70 family)
MNQTLSFPELVRKVESGDEQAAAQLVRDFEPLVRRELRFRLRDARARLQLDSMDICQSVMANFFVRVVTGEYSLQEPGDLVKLLVTMTRNKVTEKMRNQHRQRRDSRLTVRGVDPVIASPDPTPSRALAGKELLEQIRQSLNDEERRLLDLRCQGLSWEEIAPLTGGSPGARRKQLVRAIDEMLEKLGLDEL